VVERKWFNQAEGVTLEMTRGQFADLLRMVRKHQRRRLRCEEDARGYRHTKPVGWWGHRGKSSWFGNPEDFKRMIELVKQNHPEGKSA